MELMADGKRFYGALLAEGLWRVAVLIEAAEIVSILFFRCWGIFFRGEVFPERGIALQIRPAFFVFLGL